MEFETEIKKSYYQSFKERHGDIINEKKECDECGGSYSYFNKSSHKKSKRHQNALQIIKKYQPYDFTNVFKEEKE
jgi:hypothetical protein